MRQLSERPDGPQSLDERVTGRRWGRLKRLGTSFQGDDSSINQALIKESKVTICGPQPAQRPSCSDKSDRPSISRESWTQTLPPFSDQPLPGWAEPPALKREALVGGTKMAVSPPGGAKQRD